MDQTEFRRPSDSFTRPSKSPIVKPHILQGVLLTIPFIASAALRRTTRAELPGASPPYRNTYKRHFNQPKAEHYLLTPRIADYTFLLPLASCQLTQPTLQRYLSPPPPSPPTAYAAVAKPRFCQLLHLPSWRSDTSQESAQCQNLKNLNNPLPSYFHINVSVNRFTQFASGTRAHGMLIFVSIDALTVSLTVAIRRSLSHVQRYCGFAAASTQATVTQTNFICLTTWNRTNANRYICCSSRTDCNQGIFTTVISTHHTLTQRLATLAHQLPSETTFG